MVARKPLTGTVAANVLAHGTGALNVDACRVSGIGYTSGGQNRTVAFGQHGLGELQPRNDGSQGRWPANVVLTHPAQCTDVCVEGCPVFELDAQSGTAGAHGASRGTHDRTGAADWRAPTGRDREPDQGGASRFFPTFRYQAKAPTSERPKIDGQGWPTVKPLALMRWLVRLVTPPGGLVLDPFAGTGATLQAAELERFNSLGVELDPFAYQLACQRLGIQAAA